MHFLRTLHILTLFRENIAAGRADLFQNGQWNKFLYKFRTAQVIREHQMQIYISDYLFKQYYMSKSAVDLNISTAIYIILASWSRLFLYWSQPIYLDWYYNCKCDIAYTQQFKKFTLSSLLSNRNPINENIPKQNQLLQCLKKTDSSIAVMTSGINQA